MDVIPDLESDEDEEGFEEDEDEKSDYIKIVCLFCSSTFSSPELVYSHCRTDHGFSITDVIRKWVLDDFDYIRLVNFIRLKSVDPRFFSTEGASKELWKDESYLKPVIDNDGLLQVDIEDLVEPTHNGVGDVTIENDSNVVTLPAKQYHLLLQQLNCADRKVKEMESQLAESRSQIEKMKSCVQDLVLSSSDSQASVLPCRTVDEDAGYFSSYAHHGIHEEMLKDRVRTESYQEAINQFEELFKNKVVLDVGCGTGILSMFAARAGAKQVIAVDMSDVVYQAIDIVRENKLDDVISVIRSKVEDVELPVKQVDIILSEWMGYFLLFESMLDSVLYARDNFLASDGHLFPNWCSIHVAAVSNVPRHKERIGFWENVYGFQMSCMASAVVKDALVETVDEENVVSNCPSIKELDLHSCVVSDLDFTSQFELLITRRSLVTGIAGYFDVKFGKGNSREVGFSTCPSSKTTHWKQTVFYLREPLAVCQGETLRGSIDVRKNAKDTRCLLVMLAINGRVFYYSME